MLNWMDRKMIMASLKVKKFLEEERGDTNFISILIILGVVVILAGLFMGFKDQIVGQVQKIMDGFTIK